MTLRRYCLTMSAISLTLLNFVLMAAALLMLLNAGCASQPDRENISGFQIDPWQLSERRIAP